YLAQNNSELMATILLKVYQSSDGTVSEAQVKDKVQRLGIESAYDEVVSNTKSPKTDGEEFLHRRKVIGERRALSTMAHIKEYDIQKIVKRLTQGHD
ncbi:MAG: hypothetical protein NTV34_04655, partial [Proteobacteria bacterium]|nr:hypothetical protein [Pseudomonadota bacterium]